MIQDEPVMQLLQARVPLTLLLDLTMPPDAAEILRVEGGSAEWLQRFRHSA